MFLIWFKINEVDASLWADLYFNRKELLKGKTRNALEPVLGSVYYILTSKVILVRQFVAILFDDPEFCHYI